MKEEKQKSKIMSLKEIENCKVNYEIVREAVNQSEKKLIDFLNNKNDINEKIFSLFKTYISILISLVTAASFIMHYAEYKQLLYLISPLSISLLISIMFCLFAMKADKYGSLGTKAGFWLRKDILEGDIATLSIMLGYILQSYQERIVITFNSNEKKIKLQNTSIYLIVLGIILSVIFFLLQYHFHLYELHPYLFPLLVGVEVVMIMFACWYFPKKL